MSTDTGPPAMVGGRYTVGDLIGRGGAADVFRARDELLGRDVAIKMFNAAGSVTPTDVEPGDPADPAEKIGDIEEGQEARHRREVLTLAGLSHPGLVTVYDVGDEDGRAYFVMQLIEGDTLAQRVRAGPLPVVDVVALGAALADALAYVHRRGVVHRDVKPGNVLLDAEGRAHLSDFGIAAVHDAAPVTAAGMVIGTASYLSPEQVRGEPIDGAVDIYALGLVLIECLTGRREYPGNALEAAVARLHRRPVVPTGLSPGLEALLTAMTADDAVDRPTAEEVVAGLRGVSREVGMDAETVLSPVLMTAPTSIVAGSGPMAVGPPPVAEPLPTGASPLARPEG
ncbi:serine/threonine-protein kinase, partial [Actinomycetospora succinea]